MRLNLSKFPRPYKNRWDKGDGWDNQHLCGSRLSHHPQKGVGHGGTN